MTRNAFYSLINAAVGEIDENSAAREADVPPDEAFLRVADLLFPYLGTKEQPEEHQDGECLVADEAVRLSLEIAALFATDPLGAHEEAIRALLDETGRRSTERRERIARQAMLQTSHNGVMTPS